MSVVHAFAPATAFGGYDARRETDRVLLTDRVAPRALRFSTTQTHSARVAVVVRDGTSARADLDADRGIDGVVTAEPDLLLHAISADCPLLFLACDAPRAIAVVHCGWRGTAGGIVAVTLDRMTEAFDVPAARLSAAISPGAGGCCYEVGSEVTGALAAVGVAVERCTTPGAGRPLLDLKRALVQLLEGRGVARERIEVAAACSICGGARFHSHRRSGGTAGRSSGVIAWIGNAPGAG